MPEDSPERDPPERDDSDSRLTRRRLVASGAATWASVSLAGCNYITDPGTETETETPTVTTETTTTDDPSPSNETDDGEQTETPTEERTTSCANIGRFARGMEVGLHVGIFDPETGDPLGSDAVESVNIEFPDADYDPIELNWEGPHEAYDRATWGAKIVTDATTEPGTYEYVVNVETSDERDLQTTIMDRFTIV